MAVDEFQAEGGCGSALKALLKKMDYHVPTRAQLVHFMETILCEVRNPSAAVSDVAVTTAMRSFDIRFGFHHARQSKRAMLTDSGRQDAAKAECAEAQTFGRVLRQRQEDPITFTVCRNQWLICDTRNATCVGSCSSELPTWTWAWSTRRTHSSACVV